MAMLIDSFVTVYTHYIFCIYYIKLISITQYCYYKWLTDYIVVRNLTKNILISNLVCYLGPSGPPEGNYLNVNNF